VRLLKQAGELPGGAQIVWRNHRRLAKRRAHAIQHCRGEKRRAKLYRDLIAATRASVCALQQALQHLAHGMTIEAIAWRGEVGHYLPLVARLIDQAERRVLAGEAVPAGEKLVSLFETHAAIIVKGGRKVQYGHKLNLTTERTGLILDVVVERAAIRPTPSAFCRCSNGTSINTALLRARPLVTVAMPAPTTSRRPRPWA